jgi:hypothetical protein
MFKNKLQLLFKSAIGNCQSAISRGVLHRFSALFQHFAIPDEAGA